MSAQIINVDMSEVVKSIQYDGSKIEAVLNYLAKNAVINPRAIEGCNELRRALAKIDNRMADVTDYLRDLDSLPQTEKVGSEANLKKYRETCIDMRNTLGLPIMNKKLETQRYVDMDEADAFNSLMTSLRNYSGVKVGGNAGGRKLPDIPEDQQKKNREEHLLVLDMKCKIMSATTPAKTVATMLMPQLMKNSSKESTTSGERLCSMVLDDKNKYKNIIDVFGEKKIKEYVSDAKGGRVKIMPRNNVGRAQGFVIDYTCMTIWYLTGMKEAAMRNGKELKLVDMFDSLACLGDKLNLKYESLAKIIEDLFGVRPENMQSGSMEDSPYLSPWLRFTGRLRSCLLIACLQMPNKSNRCSSWMPACVMSRDIAKNYVHILDNAHAVRNGFSKPNGYKPSTHAHHSMINRTITDNPMEVEGSAWTVQFIRKN